MKYKVDPPGIKRLRGYGNQKRRERILAKTPLCVRCNDMGYTTAATVIDHIIPLALGGEDKDQNLRPLCLECHKAVTGEQFGHKQRVRTGVSGWPVDD